MSDRRWSKLALLHKLETTYGTVPASAPAAADAIIATNITFSPIEAEEVSRDLLLPYLGHQGVVLAAEHGRLEFDVEIAGAGAAGDAPKYDSLLQACGLAATETEDTSVVYSIVETGQKSSTVYFNSDGVQHIFVGGRANVAMNFTPKQIPKFRFTFVGLRGTVTDATLPSVAMTGWVTPLIVNKANTVLTLHGWTAVAESLAIDLGNTLTPRFLIGDEKVSITDRKSTGTAVVEARSVAGVDWFGKVKSRARAALSLVHGTAAGNIVAIAAPAVELGRPSQGQTDNIVNYSIPLMFCPDEGLDELTITVR